MIVPGMTDTFRAEMRVSPLVALAVRMPCNELIHDNDAPCGICGEPTPDGYDTRPVYLLQRLGVARLVSKE